LEKKRSKKLGVRFKGGGKKVRGPMALRRAINFDNAGILISLRNFYIKST